MANSPCTACTSANVDSSPCSEINRSASSPGLAGRTGKFIGGQIFRRILYLCNVIPINSTSWLATSPKLHAQNDGTKTYDTITVSNQHYSPFWTDLNDQNLKVNSAGKKERPVAEWDKI